MSHHLTIAYVTHRREPHLEWFADSLARELRSNPIPHRLVIVDYYKDNRETPPSSLEEIGNVVHVKPKPCVWQGEHRLTKRNYFAAASTRNTALCYAPDGWIAFADDLSVLMPGWLKCVTQAMSEDYIVLGAYKKVLGLVVDNGEVVGYRDHRAGLDSRWYSGSDLQAMPAAPSWLFGCSFATPVEALLKVNGFDEDVDPTGGEDYVLGIMLHRAGYGARYDRRMLTLESEEGHFIDEPFHRIDKGVSPHDRSHAMLNMTMAGRNTAANYFGPDGIRGLRDRILSGEPFPVTKIPEHDWFDGQPLVEM